MAEQPARTSPQTASQAATVPPNSGNGRAAAAPQPGGKARAAAPEMKDSFREVVETIVFVVVLVLLLKAFVAEAFVIPTGSMAETLYGYQKLVKCPKCQYEFPVNCSNEVDPQQGPPTPVIGCTCPNCRFAIDFAREGMNPPPNTGDRVLVAKFLYDLHLFGSEGPHRGDVVVFKYPEEPQRIHVPMNYIKRLIGLPGETIAIHYGKLYVTNDLHYDDAEVRPEDLWRREYMHQDDPQALELFKRGQFRIIRKPPQEILATRRIVFDNDHQAKDLVNKTKPRWGAEGDDGSWKPDDPAVPRRFDHAARPGQELSWLRYRNYIPGPERHEARLELITDFMGYNTWVPSQPIHSSPPQNWVGDLLIECEVDVQAAEGELVLELSKGVDRFQARWDLATGRCTLFRGKEELGSAETTLRRPGQYRLRFANVDERLVVWVDSSLPFGDGVVYEAAAQKGPRAENDLQPASIGVRGSSLAVSRLRLWRDTYYTVHISSPAIPDAGREVDFSQPGDWQALNDLPVRTMYVQPGHYLCLGDNSPESSDGRSWGTVPQRLLLGRAMLIYYPFSRAGRIR
jgi:signal peptidase I